MYKIIAIIAAILVFGGVYWMNSGSTLEAVSNVESTEKNAAALTTTDGAASEGAQSTGAPETSPPSSPATPAQEEVKKIMKATLHTTMGNITIEFADATAPKTVTNFVTLAKSGFYDNTKFHRVIRGFMNQGGDPLSKDDSMKDRWGTGGPGYTFEDELGPTNKNAAGTISMANAGPNTNGSQFFINAVDNFSLDGKHTVFGKVVAGLDVVEAINATPTDGRDRPITPVVIQNITLE